jgi:hypothetical protein
MRYHALLMSTLDKSEWLALHYGLITPGYGAQNDGQVSSSTAVSYMVSPGYRYRPADSVSSVWPSN